LPRGILRKAIIVWESKDRRPAVTTEELLEDALEQEFESQDGLHEECRPTIEKRLELYLKQYQGDFVIVDDAT
jgi:hypothetical protein